MAAFEGECEVQTTSDAFQARERGIFPAQDWNQEAIMNILLLLTGYTLILPTLWSAGGVTSGPLKAQTSRVCTRPKNVFAICLYILVVSIIHSPVGLLPYLASVVQTRMFYESTSRTWVPVVSRPGQLIEVETVRWSEIESRAVNNDVFTP